MIILFTAGESLLLNHIQTFVSRIAPHQMFSRYFAFYGLHWDISRAIGPYLGVLVSIGFGGAVLFLSAGAVVAPEGIAQCFAIEHLNKRRKSAFIVPGTRTKCYNKIIILLEHEEALWIH